MPPGRKSPRKSAIPPRIRSANPPMAIDHQLHTVTGVPVVYPTETSEEKFRVPGPGFETKRRYSGELAEATVPLPEREDVQLSTAGPVAQKPVGAVQLMAGRRRTSAGAVADHDKVTDPASGAGPGTIHVWFAWAAIPGSLNCVTVVVEGPVERKNRVSTNPAPRTAMAAPVMTKPVRTITPRVDLPIVLRDYRHVPQAPSRAGEIRKYCRGLREKL